MIDIAIGKSRKEENWKNKKISWDSLVSELSNVRVTSEKYADYMAAAKDRQDEIKDVGGFVGGYIVGGNRKKGSVKHRQIVSLDLDYATMDIWDTYTMLYGEAAIIHSTHKHSKKTPRFRIIIPLNRAVSPAEYEAIARKIAGTMGIRYFDPTTFQVERLMYWPSISIDSKYYFEEQEGDFVDADAVLASYHDWEDMSAWPQCPSEKKAITREVKNQEDPTQKKNIIGAFCRVYSISAAIEEFLEDVYEPTGSNRYTYIEGSGNNGAVVYDDLYLYSNHGSDPASMQLCNAFDLVRIHKFGHLDSDTSKPVTKLESYKKMLEFTNSKGAVIREIGEFAGLTPGEWLGEMGVTKGGDYEDTIDNLVKILDNDDNLQGAFAYNEFDYRDYIMKPVPWHASKKKRPFTDKDDAGLRHYLEKTYDIFHVSKSQDAVAIILNRNKFHPVRDYLDTLKWDGTPRIENLLIEHFGAEDSEYTKSVTKKTLVAAVARIRKPGTKFDYMLTLVGEQGLRKSTFWDELGGEWYSDTMGNLHTKESFEALQGVWILEWGELAGLKKAEVETVKNYITKKTDKYRLPYARRAENFPRQNIFGGSTNEIAFLRDPTGGRRFWPVMVYKKYKYGSLDRDQVWAEAQYLFENFEDLYLSDELESDAAEIQKQHAEVDERKGLIEQYLNMTLPDNWAKRSVWERRSYLSQEAVQDDPGTVIRDYVCVAEIWVEALKCELKDMTTVNTKYIHNLMMNMPGWERRKQRRFTIYGVQRAYFRSEVPQDGPKRKASRVFQDFEN